MTFNELILKVPLPDVNILFVYLPPKQGVVLCPWQCHWPAQQVQQWVNCPRVVMANIERVAGARGKGNGG